MSAAVTSVVLEVPDPDATTAFLEAAFGLGSRIAVRACDSATTGFRGFTLSLVVSQPSTVDSLVGTALEAGATTLKPVTKSFWGYGGVVQAPDGTIWKIATSSKKDTGTTTREIDDVVLLLGVADVKASKRFYVERGLGTGRSFGGKYVEFAHTPGAPVTLALLPRKALAKDAGVDIEGSGSHRLVLGSDADPCTDPDGFAWETAPAAALA